MKNRRAITAMAAVALVIGGAVVAALRWYAAGGAPPGPASFLDSAELRRTVARLEAHRLDASAAIALCEEVLELNQAVAGISFSNPAVAQPAIRDLGEAAQRMAHARRALVRDLEAGHPGGWQPAFDDWATQISAACRDGLSLCRLLLRTDLAAAPFAALQELVVEGKDLSARALAFPLWRGDPALRATWYPAFEQAYRDRGESSRSRLRGQVFAAPAPVLRWYYARLFQDHSPLRTPYCAESLRRQAAEMDQLIEDLSYTDARGLLEAWRFPAQRARGCRWLGDRLATVESAPTLDSWLNAVAEAIGEGASGLDSAVEPPGPLDPAIRLAVTRWRELSRHIGAPYRNLRAQPDQPAVRHLVERLEESTRDDPDIAGCSEALFDRVVREGERTLRAMDALIATRDPAPADILRRFEGLHQQGRSLGEALGWSVSQDLTADAFNRWCAAHWPRLQDLDRLAEVVRGLHDRSLLPGPALAGVAGLLEELAQTAAPSRRQQLQQDWMRRIRPALDRFPAVQRRVDQSLGTLRTVLAEEEFRNVLQFGSRLQIETLCRQVLLHPDTPDWKRLRADAEACLKILDLPLTVPRLDLNDLGRLAETNPDYLPDPPRDDAPHASMYARYVAPILSYAQSIARIASGDLPGVCAEVVEQVWRRRQACAERYPEWPGLDLRLADALCGMSPCLPEAPGAAKRMESIFRAMGRFGFLSASQRDCLSARAEALAAWNALRRTDLADEAYPERAERCRDRLRAAGWLDPGQDDMLRERQAESSFLRTLGSLPNAFFQLRREVDRFGPAASYRDAVRRLEPLVRADMALVRESQDEDHLRELAAAYQAAAEDDLPARFAAYAGAQAAALGQYLNPTIYRLSPAFGDETARAGITLPYRILSPGLPRLGFGPRRRGRGDGLQLLLRTGSETVPLWTAGWEDDEEAGVLRLTGLRGHAADFSWTWGVPIELLIRVAHTQDPERDWVPGEDSGGSPWNPLDYARYRVRPQTYPIERFPSLEAFFRQLQAKSSDRDRLLIGFDRVLRAKAPSPEDHGIRFRLSGVSPGRDLDWPDALPPPRRDDAVPSQGEIESALDALTEELRGLGLPIEPGMGAP